MHVKAFTSHLRRVQGPRDFDLVKSEAYNKNSNPVKWLEIYRLSITLAGGGPFVMVNYFIKCLGPIPRI